MYKNIGSKIKVLAQAIGWLLFVAGVVVFAALIGNSYGWDQWKPWTALGVGVLGFVSSWVLYGFGELIENSAKIEANTRKASVDITKKQTDSKPAEREDIVYIQCPQCGTAQKANRAVCYECGEILKKQQKQHTAGENIPAWKRVEMEKQKAAESAEKIVEPKRVGEDKIICPVCGREQKADRHVCWDCGVKFKD